MTWEVGTVRGRYPKNELYRQDPFLAGEFEVKNANCVGTNHSRIMNT